jgi:thiamine-phosphate pyrophosphorylase
MRTDALRLAGMYLLTPDAQAADFTRVLRIVEQALTAGVTAVQYRNKSASTDERAGQARELVRLVHSAQALAIVNDDPRLAAEVGADGVHLGRDDPDIAAARGIIGDRLIGVSCYGDAQRADTAVAAGADAIAFGSFFPSITKPNAVRAPLELLSDARRRHPAQRVIAIGGITVDNIERVGAAGAHAAAVISAVFNAPDPGEAVRTLVLLFQQGQRLHEPQRAAV